MKLPLRWGIGGLAALWVAYPFVENEQGKLAMLIIAMAIALWAAFSLKIPPRERQEAGGLEIVHEDDGEGPAEETEERASANKPEDRPPS